MPVATCPECAKKLNVPDTATGKKVRCPGCQAVFAIPSPAVAAPVPPPVQPPPVPEPAVTAPQPPAAPKPARAAVPKVAPKALPKFKKGTAPEPEDDDGDDREADERPRTRRRGAGDDADGGEGKTVPGLSCPKCEAAVRALPPDQFSRKPGYVCVECKTLMRPAGSGVGYVGAIVLGVAIVLLACGLVFVAIEAEKNRLQLLGAAAALGAAGVGGAVWGFTQRRLPVPLGAKAPPSRAGLLIAIIVIGLLILGGIAFGLMYVIQEGL